MTSTPDDLAPDSFDLDGWINGSKPTVRSCEIVGRGDLVAQAEDLLRRYERAKNTPADDRGLNDDSPDALLSALEVLEEQMSASRTTWHLRALLPDEVDDAAKAAEAAKPDGQEAADLTAFQLAAAVVRVEQPNGSVIHSATAAQIIALRERLGDLQIMRLVQALNRAMSEDPMISGPFSQTSSPGRDGLA
ncbi:hypothetical protein ACPPVT_07485 [Angustibacter sp. McL0619]|uniref:hypothetical protein n=1 Tax=Angustibacter sp. McL0619 TaxID=3415676 RepID=UPI003CF07270